MAINKEKYIAKFIDEGLENAAIVETLVFEIKDGLSVDDDLATVLRSLHTLKGSSRMLEFKKIENLSHHLESVFVALRDQRIGLDDKAIKLIMSSLDLLKTGFSKIKETGNDSIDAEEHEKNLLSLSSNESYNLVNTVEKKEVIKEEIINIAKKEDDKKEEVKETDEGSVHKTAVKQSIRVPLDKIDNIIKNIASLQTLEISAKGITQSFSELNNLIKEYNKNIKDEKNTDTALQANFRKLEKLADRLHSMLRNFSIDTENSIRGSYNTVISLRTLPLSTIFDSYPRYVYELSQELGKNVNLTIEGKENEIDKNIIESLSEVFLHMVRNSIDHGIETPAARKAAGKSETGNLTISCSHESGNMKIIISDDGGGIDHEKIRQKIIKEGMVSNIAAESLTNEELSKFIFQSGFSTSKKVSSVSGRGVGMDVVRESIEALRGSVVVESILGKGTTFTIMVPLSIAAITGFPVTSGGMKFIIPSTFVETILILNNEDIITVVDRPEIKYNDKIIKLYYLNQILKINKNQSQDSNTIFVVIVRSYEDIAAIAVENIFSMKPVILKSMPSIIEKKDIFSGIVLDEDYELSSVLHIPSLIRMAKQIKTIDMKKSSLEFEKTRKSILVADDSRATREILCDILRTEGYHVDSAVDGAQALKTAKSKQYDLICTDINMPVMDGYMLTENIRKNEELATIPIIVISSLASEEEQKKAYSLGATRYIIKNSFNNNNLLDTVYELIGGNNE